MLGTFILGIAAGWGAPHAETRIKAFLDGNLFEDSPVQPKETGLYSLALCLFGAAILSMIFTTPHAASLTLGALIGVFMPRLTEKWNASKAPDYDS